MLYVHFTTKKIFVKHFLQKNNISAKIVTFPHKVFVFIIYNNEL